MGHLGCQCIGGIQHWLGDCVVDASPHIDPIWRLAIITGFLGALTTFSSFSAEVIALLQAQRWGMALLWAMLHLGTSLCLTIAGMYSVHALR